MATSPPMDVEQEKVDQHQQHQSPPPPPMAAPVEEQKDLVSLIIPPDQLQQMTTSAGDEQENPQEWASDVEDVADGLVRLSLGEHPLVEDSGAHGDADEGRSTNRGSNLKRGERKNRNTLEKLGMQPMTGVSKVTMLATSENQKMFAFFCGRGRQSLSGVTELGTPDVCYIRSMLFRILSNLCLCALQFLISFSKPDVFKFSNLESYAIFGEASSETLLDLGGPPQAQAAHGRYLLDEYDELLTGEDEEDGDEAGFPPGDIDIVMEEADVPRRAAVKALKRRGGDVVLAIMDLDLARE